MNTLAEQHLLRKFTFPMQNSENESEKKNPINIDDLIL